ncbi:hypothetical protein [Bradyrhizobium sp. dw_78]|uniref:hypothetical protein n=1 Tax=Bradyrhizobium sp. dw_78 TaxID=2719793 RepID=UPI001C4A44AC|nr:hypothetical protein [Bradyrhizobium sp. dw_78]
MTSVPEAAVFTVLGSGFGMYGYLPALMQLGLEVVLPFRYQSTLAARPELSEFVKKIIWCADVEGALARSSGVIVALRPDDQALWIPRLVRMPNIRQFILEKPIAPTPELAASLLAAVEEAGRRYRVGYTFRFTPWAHQLRAALAEPRNSIRLDWNFLAHHYRAGLANWKRSDPAGGGAVRFYGIHAIALLAELGYDDVSVSTIWGPAEAETARWEATFTGRGLCPFELKINSGAESTSFRIVARRPEKTELTLVDQSDPFASDRSDARHIQDSRVGVLEQLCRSLGEPDEDHAERQKSILALWACVERKSHRLLVPSIAWK